MTEQTGRPRRYQDPQEFAEATEAYFTEREMLQKPPSLSGLALALGFADRQSFSEYENYEEAFSLTVKKARLRIEADRQDRLLGKDTFTPGVIFDLKNNHGWKDKTEQEHTGANGAPLVVTWQTGQSDG